MRYEAVIFDLDGTLLNTLNDLGNSVNEMLCSRGYPEHPLEDYRDYVGSGARKLIECALPQEHLSEVDDAVRDFFLVYGRRWNQCSKPYPGVVEMLETLERRVVDGGLKLGVYSNKPHAFTEKCVAEYFPTTSFSVIQGQVDGLDAKPNPEGTARVLNAIGVAAERVLYVGDTRVDLLTAKNAGMHFAGVAWGFRPEEVLEDGGLYLRTPQDLVLEREPLLN